MANKKATEDMFNDLHNIVTQELLNRIKSGEATTADLKAACDWLTKNDISGVAYDGNPLDKLASVMPKIDPELVQRRLYGKSYEYNKTSEGLKIRTAANKLNRKLGTYGNGDGKDASHTGPNKGRLESPKANRTRPRKGKKYAK
jgi:hypothetical protein